MRLFDTHTHLSDKRFEGETHEIIDNFKRAGVELCIDVACDLRNTEVTTSLSREYECIYSAYGMHPHYAHDMTNAYIDELAGHMSHKKCVALGEIGLDYHYDFSPREEQKKWFAVQLELAQALNKPVILHMREATADCMDILLAHKQSLQGVMHCFSGSYETAKKCIDLGLYIAFGGSVTFANAYNLRDIAKNLPLDRLLIETDCPYMAPVPLRGKRNEPANVSYVAKLLAELKGETPEYIADTTMESGKLLFNIR